MIIYIEMEKGMVSKSTFYSMLPPTASITFCKHSAVVTNLKPVLGHESEPAVMM